MSVNAIVLTACGPSKEEAEAKQQLFADSIQKVSNDSLEKLVQDSITKKPIQTDSIIETTSNQKHLKTKLVNLQKKYEKECENLESLKHHKFLRSKHKKENQIEKQTQLIEHLKEQIRSIKSRLQ
jgi:hypothetical protein